MNPKVCSRQPSGLPKVPMARLLWCVVFRSIDELKQWCLAADVQLDLANGPIYTIEFRPSGMRYTVEQWETVFVPSYEI